VTALLNLDLQVRAIGEPVEMRNAITFDPRDVLGRAKRPFLGDERKTFAPVECFLF
jgi:hypothetical protein